MLVHGVSVSGLYGSEINAPAEIPAFSTASLLLVLVPLLLVLKVKRVIKLVPGHLRLGSNKHDSLLLFHSLDFEYLLSLHLLVGLQLGFVLFISDNAQIVEDGLMLLILHFIFQVGLVLNGFVLLILHKSFTLLVVIVLHPLLLSHLFLVAIVLYTEFVFKLEKFSFYLFFTVFRDSLYNSKSVLSLIYVRFIEVKMRNSRRPIGRKRLASACSDINTLIVALLISHPCFGLRLTLGSCETLIINKRVHGELISFLFRQFCFLLEERVSCYLLLESELPQDLCSCASLTTMFRNNSLFFKFLDGRLYLDLVCIS